MESFDTAGNFTWQVPQNVKRIKVTVIGGAGGGSAGLFIYGQYLYGGNGGTGQVVTKIMDVTPGDSHNIVVGTGGNPGIGYSYSMGNYNCKSGTIGNSSSFDSLTASGGLIGSGARSLIGEYNHEEYSGINASTNRLSLYPEYSIGGLGGYNTGNSSPNGQAGSPGAVILEW
ncbi:hypothetical protein SDC9_186116 [bioreactor metagenome]|uniref:Glycine-rich domain-containing protein n=1 Tax=bioreactor metagenome TaxID=1076179 RepID=A0A645HJM4_9ZZZZ